MEMSQIKGSSVAFGTNITLPLLFRNGSMNFVRTLLQRAQIYIKKESQADWGKRATLKATDNLIPCVRQAMKEGIHVFDCSRAYNGAEQRLARALKDTPHTPRRDVFSSLTKSFPAVIFNKKASKNQKES